MTFTGGCNKHVLSAWLEQILLPQLQRGTTIITDNTIFYKAPKIKSLMESFGCHLLYLPTYSPDLNPILTYHQKSPQTSNAPLYRLAAFC